MRTTLTIGMSLATIGFLIGAGFCFAGVIAAVTLLRGRPEGVPQTA